MSSPFRYFRKHTKAFMAIAAVMCMFLFVFVSGTGASRSENRRPPTSPVATWNGGSINEGELSALVRNRLVTDEFLRALVIHGGAKNDYDLPTNLPMLLLPPNRDMDEVRRQVLYTEVLADLATNAGMTVSDTTINRYMREFGLKRVDSDVIRGILSVIGDRNPRANEAIVFATLRKLLLADFYRASYNAASIVVLPEQRWEDWQSVNERISLQAAVLPVEKFLGDVPQPTEADLRQLFEQHKKQDPDIRVQVGGREMPAPTPGFAIPRRVKLHYLVGDIEARTEKLLASVTDEEIADYYERNKRSEFAKSDELDDAFDDMPSDDEAATDEPADSLPTDAPVPGEAADEEAATGGEATNATSGETPAGPPGEDATEGDATDGDATETDGTGGQPAPSGEAAPAAGDADQSNNPRSASPFRFTAFQADPAVEPAIEGDEVPATEPSAETGGVTPDGDALGDASNDPADNDQGDQPADVSPGAATAPDTEETPDDEGDDEEVVEYKPLEEVRDEIRQTLAHDKAVVELRRDLGESVAKLQSEYNQYGRQVVENRELEQPAPEVPARLNDLKWLADEHDLGEAKTTDALTAGELYETQVGKAFDEQSGRSSVTGAAFLTHSLYEPFLAKDLDGNWYLVIKTEDTPQRVPKFDEVSDQVADAWKRIEAAKLAEKKAKELAKESETSADSFDQFFADKGYEVIKQTGLFSWRNYPIGPGLGQPPELSDVPELKNVGPAFMKTAFGLKDAETAGLLNYDESTAYVIRLHSRQYSEAELKKLFLQEDNTWPGRMDMAREHQFVFQRLVDPAVLTDLAGFKLDKEWERRQAEGEQEGE